MLLEPPEATRALQVAGLPDTERESTHREMLLDSPEAPEPASEGAGSSAARRLVMYSGDSASAAASTAAVSCMRASTMLVPHLG